MRLLYLFNDSDALSVATISQASLALLALWLVGFIITLVRHRMRFMRLKRQGLPMPPYNPILGHLGLAAKITKTLPSDFHGHYLASEIKRLFPELPPIFYLDVWPTGPPLIVITSAAGSYQIIQEPKHKDILGFLQPLIGKQGLVTMEGHEWKYWRSIFNPGFNTNHLQTLVPGIVENTLVLCDILRERAESESMFSLFETMSKLTMDMSCLATLGTQLNAQRNGCELVSAFRSQANWIPKPNEMNPFKKLNPLRHLVYRYNRWRMDRFVSCELDKRFEDHRKNNVAIEGKKRSKPVVNLALETYLSERPKAVSSGMDPTFKQFALSQMKLFLFAGYDTTASAIVYAIHLLSLNPDALKKVVSELDEVLGLDTDQTASRISKQPQLLNRLTYTSAVIKEGLRLYPPVSNTRIAGPGFQLRSEDGSVFETDGFMLWGVHQAVHRSAAYWPSPDDFIPERWIVGPEHPLYPHKDAWRPFERGPRNCIGQELALLEVKIVLAMVLREFEFKDAYAEYDRVNDRKGPVEVQGDRAYQVLLGSSKPNNGYPCRVTVR